MQRYKKNDSIITQQGLSIILGRSIILETEVKEKKKMVSGFGTQTCSRCHPRGEDTESWRVWSQKKNHLERLPDQRLFRGDNRVKFFVHGRPISMVRRLLTNQRCKSIDLFFSAGIYRNKTWRSGYLGGGGRELILRGTHDWLYNLSVPLNEGPGRWTSHRSCSKMITSVLYPQKFSPVEQFGSATPKWATFRSNGLVKYCG